MVWNLETTFVISDLHFYHRAIFNFDPKCRELFGDVEGRVRIMSEWWNEIVKPSDSVLVLGDVCFRSKGLHAIRNLNGEKFLIRGNHDLFSESRYIEDAGFVKILPSVEINRVIFTHFPVHPIQLNSRYRANIHGHLHGENIFDTRYYNVSVENINYRPKRLSEIFEELL